MPIRSGGWPKAFGTSINHEIIRAWRNGKATQGDGPNSSQSGMYYIMYIL